MIFRFGIFFVLQTVLFFILWVSLCSTQNISGYLYFCIFPKPAFFTVLKILFFFFFRSVLSVRGGKGLRVYSLICLIFTAKHCVTYGSQVISDVYWCKSKSTYPHIEFLFRVGRISMLATDAVLASSRVYQQ